MQTVCLLNQQQNDGTVQSGVKLQRKTRRKGNKNLLERYYMQDLIMNSVCLSGAQITSLSKTKWEKNISHRFLQLSHSEQSSLCIVKPETPKGCMEIIQTVLQNIICPLRGHTSLGNRRLKSNRERKQNDNRNHT